MTNVHPFSGIIYTLFLLILVLINNNPLIILVYLSVIIINIILLNGIKDLINSLKFSIIPVLLIIIINPIVSQTGRTVLIRKRIPLFPGLFVITFEGIMYGINMGIKMLVVLLVVVLYSKLTDRDEVFSYMSKYAHKLTLVCSMSLNIIHRLLLDVNRVKEVMISRGIIFNHKSKIQKIKAYYPLLKVILISALEGSISRAEALYSKEYGFEKRSSYFYRELTIGDILLIINSTAILIINIYAAIYRKTGFKFYPQISTINTESLIFGFILLMLGITGIIISWRSNKWKFLKYRV